jgi:hypothetical protein
MNRFLVVLLLLVIGVVALGFYLDWFHLSTDRASEKPSVKIEIDPDKIRQDKDRAIEKVHEAEESIKEKTGIGTKKAEDKGSQP